MPILVIIIAAALVYVFQNWIYKRFWSRNLHASIAFEDHYIHEGEKTQLTETLSNGKILPLPWVYVKFQLKRNGTVEHFRSDLFSIRFFQQIRRKIPFESGRRGVITVRGIDLISNDLFITHKYVKVLSDAATLYVYPSLIPAEEFQIPFQKIMGEIASRRYRIEDPFLFKGIRDYQSWDSFKSINFKASARAGKWLVNVNDFSVSQKITLLLSMDRANQYYDARLYESSIRLAASMADAFERDGIPMELLSNGIDAISGQEISVESGCGEGHLHAVMENLTRLEVSLEVRDFMPFLHQAADDDAQDTMYVLIAPFFGDAMIEAYEQLLERRPDTLWILPVTSMDLARNDFTGKKLADTHEQIHLWEIGNA